MMTTMKMTPPPIMTRLIKPFSANPYHSRRNPVNLNLEVLAFSPSPWASEAVAMDVAGGSVLEQSHLWFMDGAQQP